MVCDYEASWLELQQLVAGKTQHGREGLLASMAEIAGRHRVPSGELERLLRLYGVEVQRARSISTDIAPAGEERFRTDEVRAGIDSPGAIIDGGHDGRNDSGASNGRRRV